MGSVNIKIEGMACGGCEKTVEVALAELNGVESVEASHTTKSAEVVYEGDEFNLEEATEAVKKAGYTVPA